MPRLVFRARHEDRRETPLAERVGCSKMTIVFGRVWNQRVLQRAPLRTSHFRDEVITQSGVSGSSRTFVGLFLYHNIAWIFVPHLYPA